MFLDRLSAYSFAVILLTALSLPAIASPVLQIDSNGVLTGITDVSVGTLGDYDVSFVNGSCDTVFSLCSPAAFTFNTSTTATEATQALADIFESAAGASFRANPTLINGCLVLQYCYINTPFESDPKDYPLSESVLNELVDIEQGANSDSIRPGSLGPKENADYITFAVFTQETPAGNDVPEPPMLGLLGVAGLALGFSTRRRGKIPAKPPAK